MKNYLSFSLLLFAACHSAPEENAENFDKTRDIPSLEQPPPPAEMEMEEADWGSEGPAAVSRVSQPLPATYDTVAKQIIKTASLVYEVKQLQQANQKVDSLVKLMGGYVSSANQQNDQQRHSLDMTIKVPSRNFDKLMNALGTLPEQVDHKSVEARDVTEQYVDLRSRLKTKRKVAERYRELLKKADNIKEILEVEEMLRQLEEEIDAKEGQLRYLTHQVSYSTIELDLYEVQSYEYLPSRAPHFGQRMLSAFDDGWQLLLGILLVIFRLWPLLLIAALVGLGMRRYHRKRNIGEGSKS